MAPAANGPPSLLELSTTHWWFIHHINSNPYIRIWSIYYKIWMFDVLTLSPEFDSGIKRQWIYEFNVEFYMD